MIGGHVPLPIPLRIHVCVSRLPCELSGVIAKLMIQSTGDNSRCAIYAHIRILKVEFQELVRAALDERQMSCLVPQFTVILRDDVIIGKESTESRDVSVQQAFRVHLLCPEYCVGVCPRGSNFSSGGLALGGNRE